MITIEKKILSVICAKNSFVDEEEFFHALVSLMTNSEGCKWDFVSVGRVKNKKVLRFYKIGNLIRPSKKILNGVAAQVRSKKEYVINLEKKLFSFNLGSRGKQRFIFLMEFNRTLLPALPELRPILKTIKVFFHHFSRIMEMKKNSSLVFLDDVTQLYNQRKLFIDLDDAIVRFKKKKEIFSLLFIDIDHFKLVNDQFGHLVGSQLLIQLGTMLKKNLRESDLVYRYGGDEFVLLVPKADLEVARLIGERLLHSIMRHKFKIKEKRRFQLSISIGIAEYPKNAKSRERILEIADRMMYHAKTSGRGRVCLPGEFYN